MKFQKNFLNQLKMDIKMEKLMKGSELLFDYVHLLYYKYHKINLHHGGSYIDSPDWIKNKKAITKR